MARSARAVPAAPPVCTASARASANWAADSPASTPEAPSWAGSSQTAAGTPAARAVSVSSWQITSPVRSTVSTGWLASSEVPCVVSSACQPRRLPPNTSVRSVPPGSWALPHSSTPSSRLSSARCQASSRCCHEPAARSCSSATRPAAAAACRALRHRRKVSVMPGPQMTRAMRSLTTGGPLPPILAAQPLASSSTTNRRVLGIPRNLRIFRYAFSADSACWAAAARMASRSGRGSGNGAASWRRSRNSQPRRGPGVNRLARRSAASATGAGCVLIPITPLGQGGSGRAERGATRPW